MPRDDPARPEPESSADFLRRVGTDGMAWADAMHERFPAASAADLHGWCCNLIEAGRAAGRPDDAAPPLHDDRAVHAWFGLSYAGYLTIPRSVLQAMPGEWQEKMVALLDELDASIDWRPKGGCYWVQLKDDEGRYRQDPLSDYRHGRGHVEALRIDRPPALDPGADAR